MFNLVKNELTKIFSKKAIFIALLVFLLLLLLLLLLSILVLGMQKYYEDISVVANEKDSTYLEEELKNVDTSTENGKNTLLDFKK